MPFKPQFDRRSLAIVILLVAVLLTVNFSDLSKPFWQLAQTNPLSQVHSCAGQFSSYLKDTPRVGYFYEWPRYRTFFADKRSTPQVQMQYALAPIILDSNPEIIQELPWVIGYFENEKLAESKAQDLAPALGLEIEAVCRNFVLLRRGE
jgi:hypothetical protein